MPSVDAYLVLVRLDLRPTIWTKRNRMLDAALQIDPQSKPALELQQADRGQGRA